MKNFLKKAREDTANVLVMFMIGIGFLIFAFVLVTNITKNVNIKQDFVSISQVSVEEGIKSIDGVGFLHEDAVYKVRDLYKRMRSGDPSIGTGNSLFIGNGCQLHTDEVNWSDEHGYLKYEHDENTKTEYEYYDRGYKKATVDSFMRDGSGHMVAIPDQPPRVVITLTNVGATQRQFGSHSSTWVFSGPNLDLIKTPEDPNFEGYNMITANFYESSPNMMASLFGVTKCQELHQKVESVRFQSQDDVVETY